MKSTITSKILACFCLAALLVSFSFSPAIAAEKININTANAEQLETLENIGQVKAKRIIDYREAQPFQCIEDIKKVDGIGESTFNSIKDKITVG